MPCGLGSICRKIGSLFRGGHPRSRFGSQDQPQDDVESPLLPRPGRTGARDLPSAGSSEPPLGHVAQTFVTAHQDPAISRPNSRVTRRHRQPMGTGGGEEADLLAVPKAGWTRCSPPTVNHDLDANEQNESDKLRPYPPNHSPHGSVYRRTPSPQASIGPSTLSTPSPPWQGPLPPSTSPLVVNSDVSSHFAGAHDFRIQNQHINVGSAKTLFEHLDPHIAHDAAHDSKERCNAPACHEETRVAIRQNIMGWINHGDEEDEPKKIMWLSGPAGGGKTAIAGSVAQQCKAEGSLAATFMFSSFSGSADRMSKRCFVATLAYHISQHDALYVFEAHLLAVLERRRDIFHKGLKDQAEHLILAPLRLVHPHGWKGWPKVVIVDGLDEVVASRSHDPTGRQPTRTSEEDQVEILEVLLTLSQNPSFPFRIFISSRPERNITNFFAAAEVQRLTDKLFLDSKYEPDADIKLFLESKFAEVRRHRGISESWPGEDALGHVVDMSSGQFIVPTTVIRWVESGVPQKQLDEVLKLQKETVRSRNPFASLDILYRHILLRTRDLDDDPRLVVKWILMMSPGSRYSDGYSYHAVVWRYFLEDLEGEFDYRMEPMTSLVSVPPPHDTSSNVAFYHKSLADFLLTKSRCGDDLYVDDADMIPFIARRLLQTFKKKQVGVPFTLPDPCLRHLATMVVNSNIDLSDHEEEEGIMKGFLLYEAPTPGSKAALSACDATWWVDLICTSGFGMISTAQAIGGIYCTIHQAMECNRNTPSSPDNDDGTKQAGDSGCHETCELWRRDILAKAKELGWCVHRLEEIEVDELENVKWGQMRDLIKNVRSTGDWRGPGNTVGCEVCLIPALEDARRRAGRVLPMY